MKDIDKSNCICRHMIEAGTDMHVTNYISEPCDGYILSETYGHWCLEPIDKNGKRNVKKSIDIIFCPFCGERLNRW